MRVHVGSKSKARGIQKYGREKETLWYTALNNVVQEYQKRNAMGYEYVAYNAYFGEPEGFNALKEALEHYVETNQEKNYI